MSELIHTNDNRATIRWKLLASASVVALTGYLSATGIARAEDSDRPQLWIELGGQMEMLQGTSSPFTAPFMFPTTVPDVYGKKTFTEQQSPPRFAFGAEGKISFQPEASDWLFSAAIRYGRSHVQRHAHYQTTGIQTRGGGYYYSGVFIPLPSIPPDKLKGFEAFADIKAAYSERHLIVDFSAGKDVGIGLLGHDGSSNVAAGVRAVDFTQGSTIGIFARPKIEAINRKYYPIYLGGAAFDQYSLTGHTQRSFKGIGPSLSWNASAAVAGNQQDGELILDWGINAALLFGRQKAKTDQSTRARYFNQKYGYQSSLYPQRFQNNPLRSRNVTVPNLGGSIGVSLKWPNAKISFGYRGDIFFKAIDRGIDARKDSNLSFNGPYASISIGLGD